jgi:acetyl esterase/lipase
MAAPSDVTLDASRFNPSNMTENTKKINGMLETIGAKGPHWHEVGLEKYQQMRDAGETPLPPPVYLPEAQEAVLPSREVDRQIPLRIYKPDNGEPSKGIFLHFHGGGFVLGNHQGYAGQPIAPFAPNRTRSDPKLSRQDRSLRLYANTCQLTAISVGYRHAPAHPYPAPIDDCIDAATYLADYAEAEYGAPLLFMGGESAGACAAVLATFDLMRARPAHKLAGLVLPYGWFDMTLSLPSISTSTVLRVVNLHEMQKFREAYLPGISGEELRASKVSPLFEDFEALREKLPPALFLVGTADPLLDETLLMNVKWMAAGAEAVLRVWPGCPHGFTAFPGFGPAEEALEIIVMFLGRNLEGVKAS